MLRRRPGILFAMIITPSGGYGFKLVSGDTTIAVNPPSQRSPFKVPKFGAHVVLISHEAPEWSGEETASLGSAEPFVIRGPGAYEVGQVVVTGYASDAVVGKEVVPQANTVFVLKFDGITSVILGALASHKLSPELRADLDDVNIVFVPVGETTLDATRAHELVVSLEPNLIIPYAVGPRAELEDFLETEGAKGVKPVEKLTLRAKEVSALEAEIALLS